MGALERIFREMLARKAPHPLGELLLLGRKIEIHAVLSSPFSPVPPAAARRIF